jgi:ankyrin repeat protein
LINDYLFAQGKGVNINEAGLKGQTALMYAALHGHKNVVEYLVVRKRETNDYIEEQTA